jgi:hypothetical protein
MQLPVIDNNKYINSLAKAVHDYSGSDEFFEISNIKLPKCKLLAVSL